MPMPSRTRSTSHRPAAAAAVLLLLLGAAVATAAEGRLRTAVWRAGFLGREVHGTACWLTGPQGELRVELLRLAGPAADAAPHLASLLARRGRGTTLIVPEPGTMLLQPWGEEWREVEPPLTDHLRTLLHAVARAGLGSWGPDSAWSPSARVLAARRLGPARPRWRRVAADGDGTLRLEVGAAAPAGPDGLRGELTRRGRGRGGRGEVWRLSRGGSALAVRSSRWPGELEIGAVAERAVTYPDYETFLPLWSLERLLEGVSGGP